jgi:hypothetical protein
VGVVLSWGDRSGGTVKKQLITAVACSLLAVAVAVPALAADGSEVAKPSPSPSETPSPSPDPSPSPSETPQPSPSETPSPSPGRTVTPLPSSTATAAPGSGSESPASDSRTSDRATVQGRLLPIEGSEEGASATAHHTSAEPPAQQTASPGFSDPVTPSVTPAATAVMRRPIRYQPPPEPGGFLGLLVVLLISVLPFLVWIGYQDWKVSTPRLGTRAR